MLCFKKNYWKKIHKQKIPKFSTSYAFVTVKDYKKRFPPNIECRVLNLDKNELEIISKNILETVVIKIRYASRFVQWKNLFEDIERFNNVKKKPL